MSGILPVPPPLPGFQPLNTRPGFTLGTVADKLGLLSDLSGTWVGNGFNVMSLPDFDSNPPSTGPQEFRVKLNSTVETLQFTPVGGSVPNRGARTAPGSATGQTDIFLRGLSYFQRVSDLMTNEALHIEPGFWLSVPPSTVLPVQPAATVARLATIPHGDALMAQGGGFAVLGGPLIGVENSLPLVGGVVLGPPYTNPFQTASLPQGFRLPYLLDPNTALKDAIVGQNIIRTTVLIISTDAVNFTTPTPADPQDPNPAGTLIAIPNPSGSIANIPFVTLNANASRLDATFWVETVQQSDGSTFQQLQYTQRVILSFLGVDWPHISVATLVKQ